MDERDGPAPQLSLNLLPQAGMAADPTSVRIGLGLLSEAAQAQHLAWLRGGAEGAGPADLFDLAEVDDWLPLAADLRADGKVHVGPAPLPKADVYVLEARATDGLHFYRLRFTAEQLPLELAPLAGSGLKASLAWQGQGETRVQLRRLDTSPESELWNAIQRSVAPQVSTAFDDGGMAFESSTTLKPLHPAAWEAALWVDGVLAERQTVMLAPGQLTELAFDPAAAEIALAQTAQLDLHIVDATNDAPIAGVRIRRETAQGEEWAQTDAEGLASLHGMDRFATQTLELSFPEASEDLPHWPQKRLETLVLDTLSKDASDRVVRHTIRVAPLRWLVVDNALRRAGPPVRGQPYPVYLLQREEGEQWREQAADHFLMREEGLAVSIDAPGRYRVGVAAAPWSIQTTPSADIAVDSASQTVLSLRNIAGYGQHWTLQDDSGHALVNHPIQITGPHRGLPAETRHTDSSGRLQIENVNVERLHLEPVGYEGRPWDANTADTAMRFDREG